MALYAVISIYMFIYSNFTTLELSRGTHVCYILTYIVNITFTIIKLAFSSVDLIFNPTGEESVGTPDLKTELACLEVFY